MRMILGLVPFALGLAACQTYAPQPYPEPYPAPYPGPPVDRGEYRAIGTEPFWNLTIGPRMTFTDRGNNVSVAELARCRMAWRERSTTGAGSRRTSSMPSAATG